MTNRHARLALTLTLTAAVAFGASACQQDVTPTASLPTLPPISAVTFTPPPTVTKTVTVTKTSAPKVVKVNVPAPKATHDVKVPAPSETFTPYSPKTSDPVTWSDFRKAPTHPKRTYDAARGETADLTTWSDFIKNPPLHPRRTYNPDAYQDAVMARHTKEELQRLLPYYGVQAPADCNEDEFCWIGSADDDRTDAQLAKIINISVNCYADDPRLDDAEAEGCDGTSPLG